MASETPGAPKIEASLREPREGAGQLWWGNFLQKRAAQIDRRTKLAGILYWTPSVNMSIPVENSPLYRSKIPHPRTS